MLADHTSVRTLHAFRQQFIRLHIPAESDHHSCVIAITIPV
jgi:hypothetical protein